MAPVLARVPPLAAAILFALLGAAMFIGRAVIKSPQGGDFAHLYCGTRVALLGLNPYDGFTADATWEALRPPRPLPGRVNGIPRLLPPSTHLTTLPFVKFPPLLAWRVYQAVTIVFVLAMIAMAARWAGASPGSVAGLVVAGWTLALGPLHSGVHAGHPTIWCVAGTLVGMVIAEMPGIRSRTQTILAGVLLGAAIAIKPQVAMPFAVYLGLRRHGAVVWWAIGTAAALLFVSAGWLQWHVGPAWIDSWRQTLRSVAAPGGPADYGQRNSTRTHLLNLQLLFAAFLPSGTAVTMLGFFTASLAGSVWAYLLWRDTRGPQRIPPQLTAAALACLTLLPVYHRYYDATLLILVIAWVVHATTCRASTTPGGSVRLIGSVAMMSVFFLPVAWVNNVTRRGWVPAEISSSSMWEWFVVPHQVWALLFLTLILLAEMASRLRTQTAGRLMQTPPPQAPSGVCPAA